MSASPTPSSGQALADSVGIVEKLSLEDLVLKADVILLGTVESMQSMWNQAHTAIYTHVTIIPNQWIKGKPSSGPLIVRVPGGEVEGVVADVSATPSFRIGEKVVLFLRQGQESWFQVLGGFQGKLTVEHERVLGEKEIALAEFIASVQTILQTRR